MMKICHAMRGGGHLLGILFLLVPAAPLLGAPRWVLVYYRQIGNNVNANSRTIENQLYREDGTKGAGVGFTNAFNALIPIFGTSNPDGYLRVTTDLSNFYYDVRVHAPGVATDQSPNFYYQNTAIGRYYTFATQWMYVADDARVTTYPTTPVYHYDLVSGLNRWNAPTFIEPAGASSDSFSLSEWRATQGESFTVPPGINRIVSAQAFVTKQAGVHMQYEASIRQGDDVDGPQIGPTVTSREMVSVEFMPVLVNWGINDVPVTPGQKYTLRVEPTTHDGFNAYATNSKNAVGCTYYAGGVAVPGRDLLAVVTGIGYDMGPPTITRDPAILTRSVVRYANLAADALTIRNTGYGSLSYTLASDASWLSVSPISGICRNDPTTIALNYATTTLPIGSHSGTVTIAATGASNTPQTVVVNLTVTPPARVPVDYDLDGDVDQTDFGQFQKCLSGRGFAQNLPTCAGARLDEDADVDDDDLGIFLQCFGGPEVTARIDCAG